MSNIVKIEVVDVSAEYGFFGKVVYTADVRGMTDADIIREGDDLLLFAGSDANVSLRYIEEVPAAL